MVFSELLCGEMCSVRRLHLKSGFVRRCRVDLLCFWGSKVIFLWNVLRALGNRLACVSLWWDLCAQALGVCARVLKITIDHKPHSVPYEIINIQSCLVSIDAFAFCPFSRVHAHTEAHTALAAPVQPHCMCSAIDYKRPLLMSHPPIDRIVVNTWLWWWRLVSCPFCYSELDFLF